MARDSASSGAGSRSTQITWCALIQRWRSRSRELREEKVRRSSKSAWSRSRRAMSVVVGSVDRYARVCCWSKFSCIELTSNRERERERVLMSGNSTTRALLSNVGLMILRVVRNACRLSNEGSRSRDDRMELSPTEMLLTEARRCEEGKVEVKTI